MCHPHKGAGAALASPWDYVPAPHLSGHSESLKQIGFNPTSWFPQFKTGLMVGNIWPTEDWVSGRMCRFGGTAVHCVPVKLLFPLAKEVPVNCFLSLSFFASLDVL